MDGGGDGGTLEMDRLSSLPDGVLCHILSKLPTKYSARTSALSTRWKYLFLSIPIIDCHLFTRTYNFEDRDTDGYATFVSFVTRALNLITTNLLHITKFRIYLKHFQRYSLPVSVVCSWIVTAVKYNVQEIDFYCVNMESGPLPCELFTSRTLVDLKLMLHFVLSVPDSVCLPNLKTLLLGYYVSSDEKSLKKLLLSCPVLEELFLSCQMGKAKVVEVSSLSLKKLSFNIRESRRYRILLNTPNLEYLSCGTYASRGYSGDPPSSIGKAYINVKLSMEREIDKTKICQLLQLVSGTRFLSLYGDVLEALHFSKCSLPMFGNLTHLELSNDGLYGWKKLPGILQASPRLEVLVLEWGDLNHDVDFTGFTFSKPKSVPECLSVCLKTVKFKKFLGEKPEYQFIEFLLKNGGVLQKIIVRKESKDSRFDIDLEVELSDVDEEIQSEMEEYFEISKKLLSFPRRSRECQIVFDAVPMTKEAYIAKLKEIDGSSDSDTK